MDQHQILAMQKSTLCFKDDVRLFLRAEINGLHLQRKTSWGVKNFQSFLTDDVCGDEMWDFLLEKVPLPPKMIQEVDRDTIVNSPLFLHVLVLSWQ